MLELHFKFQQNWSFSKSPSGIYENLTEPLSLSAANETFDHICDFFITIIYTYLHLCIQPIGSAENTPQLDSQPWSIDQFLIFSLCFF